MCSSAAFVIAFKFFYVFFFFFFGFGKERLVSGLGK